MDGFPRKDGTSDRAAYVLMEVQGRGDSRRKKRGKQMNQHTEIISSRI